MPSEVILQDGATESMDEDQLSEVMGISSYFDAESNFFFEIFSEDESLDGAVIELQLEVFSYQEPTWLNRPTIKIQYVKLPSSENDSGDPLDVQYDKPSCLVSEIVLDQASEGIQWIELTAMKFIGTDEVSIADVIESAKAAFRTNEDS